MNPSRLLITTSWDDGHLLDLRLAEMLDRYGIPATFYIAPRSVEVAPSDRLSPAQIAELAGHFEIGGHTLHHPWLPAITLAEADSEIRNGKEELEGNIGRRLRSFCYPGGRYRPAHVEQVRDAGFTVARTVRRYVTRAPAEPLETGTTVHAYRHLKDPPLVGLRWGMQPGRCLDRLRNWDALAIALFDETQAAGGVFHLWGHSWEVDARGDWGRLERVLAHIGGRPDATYVTNGGLVAGVGGCDPPACSRSVVDFEAHKGPFMPGRRQGNLLCMLGPAYDAPTDASTHKEDLGALRPGTGAAPGADFRTLSVVAATGVS